MQSSSQIQPDGFAADVLKGLSASPKFLSSKYFYDDEGTRLFQEIMKLPEYYLTAAEHEIFADQAAEIFTSFKAGDSSFDLIELGAGDGSKTAVLIDYFLRQNADFTYSPIDISPEALDLLTEKFKNRFSRLSIQPKPGDYFHILETLNNQTKKRKIILFLGSNIGNFSYRQAEEFFRKLRAVMRSDDLLFIGFDLQKDPNVILRAYDDAKGVTAAFNLNLLMRVNCELGGNFVLGNFSHYAIYCPADCAARSFLISRQPHTVFIEALEKSFDFKAWEPILTEISQKYSLEMINALASAGDFQIKRNFFDSRNFYADTLWKPF